MKMNKAHERERPLILQARKIWIGTEALMKDVSKKSRVRNIVKRHEQDLIYVSIGENGGRKFCAQLEG